MAWFEGPAPALSDLRARALERLQPLGRLRSIPYVPAGPTSPGPWPHWRESQRLAVDHHVVARSALEPSEFNATISHLATAPFDPEYPPWQLYLLPTAEGFALVLRAHHALFDGLSAMSVMYALLDPPPDQQTSNENQSAQPPPSYGRKAAWALDALAPKGRPLPWHRPLGSQRDIAFIQIPGDVLASARVPHAQATGRPKASNTAVLLAAITGALQGSGLIGRIGGPLGACAMVPVDVHTAGRPRQLGNFYSAVRLPLPNQTDSRLRIEALDERIRAMNIRGRARASAEAVSAMPHRFTALSRAATRYVNSPWYYTFSATSLPTPAGAYSLGPARHTAAAGTQPLGPGHSMAFTMVHNSGGAIVSAITDPDYIAAEPLAAAVAEQVRLLAD
ncbi:wax ester/triacylglycerol synthase domain-containing protein [Streptomyces sp. NBC_01408]|uniref:wax ester/triacylglycerol synthase domain-containing protein n=1 Tax=Streptomyces sp. NBC_01408 TaxID=2903855 RepID=UPI002255594B|nr:wax ester/triacylglycerol synthase domain-containing protein [Streptomyces sp. NBC_01408]